jgi:hypothetical protein
MKTSPRPRLTPEELEAEQIAVYELIKTHSVDGARITQREIAALLPNLGESEREQVYLNLPAVDTLIRRVRETIEAARKNKNIRAVICGDEEGYFMPRTMDEMIECTERMRGQTIAQHASRMATVDAMEENCLAYFGQKESNGSNNHQG